MSKEKELPRMVEVRYHNHDPWIKRELIADLSHVKNLRKPFVCWLKNNKEAGETHAWPMMREIEVPRSFARFYTLSLPEEHGSHWVSYDFLQDTYALYQSYLSQFNQQ